MRIKKLNPVVHDYLATVNNEITFDSFYFKIINSSADELGYLPRVPKWISFSQRHRRLTYFAIQALRAFWLVGGAVLFFALQSIQLCLNIQKSKSNVEFKPSEHGYVFAFSPRTAEMDIPDQRARHATWVTFFWSPLTGLPKDVAHVEYSKLLTVQDIFSAFLHAVQSVYLLAGKKRQRKWVLQSYTAFRWFTARTVVDKLSGPFLMTEHFDRWAILLDSSIGGRDPADVSRLVLIQHGSVEPVSAKSAPVTPSIQLPRRLRAVNELWVYDVNSENIFRRDILSNGCGRRLSAAKYFKPSIMLTRLDEPGELRVLIVGYSLCERAHVDLYHRLTSDFKLKIYYKPHPRTVMSAQLEDIGWTVLHGSTTFPEVDLLISYPSTLVTEYAGLGVESVVHPLDIKDDELEDFYKSVVGAIEPSMAARRIS